MSIRKIEGIKPHSLDATEGNIRKVFEEFTSTWECLPTFDEFSYYFKYCKSKQLAKAYAYGCNHCWQETARSQIDSCGNHLITKLVMEMELKIAVLEHQYTETCGRLSEVLERSEIANASNNNNIDL